MAREDLHFRLRIPDDLKAQIEQRANASGKSITAEIVERLRHSFEKEAHFIKLVEDTREQLDTLKTTQSFFVGIWEDALKELRNTGSLSEENRKFVTEMTAMMRKSVGERKPSIFD
ncbi:Arc family DNA-binding protein [Aureimonas frigidaquae]|uniref:Arc family DNA-binding protein n=1 Tax=Aureimonas frigidaquae TaxID=424757 RepID=UPI0009F9142B|nr:Arc family DNA-binding protein [Aureimonas frigidaquae]